MASRSLDRSRRTVLGLPHRNETFQSNVPTVTAVTMRVKGEFPFCYF
jgi:hypothetical protein